MSATSGPTGQTVVFQLRVRDEKLGSDACDLKEEDVVQKGPAAEAQAPAAKKKSTGAEPAPKRKKTACKPQAAKSGTGEDTDESDGDEEEPQVSRGRTAKEAAVRPGSEESRARAPFKQPARQSQPRDQPATPPPKGKTSVAKSMGAKMQTVPKKKYYIMREGSRYAFLFDDLFAVTLCGTFISVMHFIALLC